MIKVRVSKNRLPVAIRSRLTDVDMQQLPDVMTFEAEPLDPQPHEAASPTEECCDECKKWGARGYAENTPAHCACPCHQKEQPKWSTPTAEKITFNVWTGGGHEEHPEKPKGIEKLATEHTGSHITNNHRDKINEIIDALFALTKSQ